MQLSDIDKAHRESVAELGLPALGLRARCLGHTQSAPGSPLRWGGVGLGVPLVILVGGGDCGGATALTCQPQASPGPG